MGQIYHLSYGLSWAKPVPEIYSTDGANARQWKNIRWVNWLQWGDPAMTLWGTMTQQAACNKHWSSECAGANNSPYSGWTQWQDAVGGQAGVRATDIQWQS